MPVYFIGRGRKGPIKIGFSKDPQKRMKSLQTGSAEPLSMLGLVKGGRAIEAIIHRRLARNRLHGEWFERCPEVESFISSAQEEVDQILRTTARARGKVDKGERTRLTQRDFLDSIGMEATRYADVVGVHWNTVARRSNAGKNGTGVSPEVEMLWRVILEMDEGERIRGAFDCVGQGQGSASDSWRQRRSDQQKEAYEKRKGE